MIVGSLRQRSVRSVRAAMAARGPERGGGGPCGASVAVAVMPLWLSYLRKTSAPTLTGAAQWRHDEQRPDLTPDVAYAGPCSEVRSLALGDVAQWLEHLLCTQGVVGSSPIVSTRSNKREP